MNKACILVLLSLKERMDALFGADIAVCFRLLSYRHYFFFFVSTLLSKWGKNDGVQRGPDFNRTMKEEQGNHG